MTGTKTIDIDLRRNLVAIYRAELTRLRYDVSGIDDDAELMRVYFGVCRRLISPQPRQILKAKDFLCSAEHNAALTQIEQLTHDGGDLAPYLSKTIMDLNYNDALLNDWGIHHLHLGTKVESDGFVERDGPLLFCRFEDKDAYFIAILPHGSWSKQKLVKTIHENWPAQIDRYLARGIKGVKPNRLSDDDIAALRKANINCFIELEDGSIYLPIGSGTVSSGKNLLDVRQADMCLNWAERMQRKIIDDFPAIEERARARGIQLPDPAVFEMRIWQEGFWAVETSSAYGLVLGTP